MHHTEKGHRYIVLTLLVNTYSTPYYHRTQAEQQELVIFVTFVLFISECID